MTIGKTLFTLLICLYVFPMYGQLKYVVYDFEGYDNGAAFLPENGYNYGSVSYNVTNTIGTGGSMLGDRVLQVSWNYSVNYGGFGRALYKFVELDVTTDYLNFYFYNPTSNTKDASIAVYIEEDDNGDNNYNNANDDRWTRTISIPRSNAWQLISLRLNTFTDENVGGNGIFDARYSGATNGLIGAIEFQVQGLIPADGNETYYIDMISFSEGPLPTGSSSLDVPVKSPGDYCMLGAFNDFWFWGRERLIPAKIESIFNPPDNRKICIAHWFIPFSENQTSPNYYPQVDEAQDLINNGYTPMITWEPMYVHLDRLDPSQPFLWKINAGWYDTYIDRFADSIKKINGDIYIRLMHEMDGNWYPWCLTVNSNNASSYVSAFRRFVDRFLARGVNNVKWVWCVNAEQVPQAVNNWAVPAYPGDSYVDVVGTDVYNHPRTDIVPPWRSFRFEGIQSYHTLLKYFPAKPIFICETGCRERGGGENAGSETKAQWFFKQDLELQSNFSKTRALIVFSINKEHDWRVNSSAAAQESFRSSIWNDPYYSNCSAPLPVIYKEISIQKSEGKAIVRWVTESEAGNHYFTVERSSDGKIFEVIGKVMAGENPQWNRYEYTDAHPSEGMNYYRLVQYDKDGHSTYSEIKYVVFPPETIQVYPNPFQRNLHITLPCNIESKLFISLTDLQGRIMMSRAYEPMNESGIDLEIADIPAGIYCLQIISQEFQQIIKLEKE